MKTIQNSQISWQENTPFSEQFEDYYFNSDGGLDETNHVFIKPSNLPERYQQCPDNHFCINETGFGTGLNLYASLQAITQLCTIKRSKPVYFFSSELFPLSVDDFKKTVANFPQFSALTDQIIEQYPPPIKGFHRLILNAGAIYLTLLFDDSVNAYQQCQHKTHVWYLDGFSPAKNSAMWQEPLFQQVARLSIPQQTHLSTFTAAGFVRRALQAQGFTIKKHAGFGKKREMISATLTDDTSVKNDIKENAKPWFKSEKSDSVKHVAIIGAGLAGCTSAEALARRGIKVTLYDSSSEICQHASGNRQGALYAKLPSKPTVSGDFHLTGLEYSLRLLNIYHCFDQQTAEQCGLLQIAINQKEQAQQQDLLDQGYYHSQVVRAVTAQQASQLAGTQIDFSGLYFERAGWVAPKEFCQKILADHETIFLRLNTEISSLKQLADNRWQVMSDSTAHDSDNGTELYDAVIVANANSAKQFGQLSDTSSKGIRGQVTHVKCDESQPLKTVVCGAGYISPGWKGKYCFGASFDLHNQELKLKEQDQLTNIGKLNKVLPELSSHLNFPEELEGKVALRCSTPDYLPLVGPAPITADYITDFGKLRKDKNWRFTQSHAPNYKGLYLNIGHGSKGLITCPLSAEYLACMLTNQPSPISNDLSNAIHPARFVIKQLIRRAI